MGKLEGRSTFHSLMQSDQKRHMLEAALSLHPDPELLVALPGSRRPAENGGM